MEWELKETESGSKIYVLPEYAIGTILLVTSQGNLMTTSGGKYFLISPNGKMLKSYESRPLEVGMIKEEKIGEDEYKVTIKYPDKEWVNYGEGSCGNYVRDMNDKLYCPGSKQVIRYSSCGKEIAELMIPDDNIEEIPRAPGIEPIINVIEEYGSAVIAPNGDVYTWKRTPDKYSIIKWTWQDSPNDPVGGPDPSKDLSATSSPTGISLGWDASPQDPGCVTGYEIFRSTTAGGPYTTLASVNKGVFKYEDATAESGITYYYRVRALSDLGPSEYSNEAFGKRGQ